MSRRSLANYVRTLLYRNTELRLRVFDLEHQLQMEQAEVQKWISLTNDWHKEAVNWQQTAIAAIAKAELIERQ